MAKEPAIGQRSTLTESETGMSGNQGSGIRDQVVRDQGSAKRVESEFF
jgi:hypothetical protein